MKAWFGIGHALTAYEPRVGGYVETDAAGDHDDDDSLRFGGKNPATPSSRSR